jgi:peptidoglycan-associated lipoprotein
MRTTMKLIAAAAALAAVFAGCSTTPETQAPAKVEERAPAPAVKTPPVTPVDVTRSQGMSPLKDPNNILSKRSIFYDFDKFDVRSEYRPLVEAHAKYLRENAGARMLIQGNADERGSREYNVGLGQRRSDGVKKMMSLLGVRDSQIESVSLGEEKPMADGHNEEAWAKNRRSDILYSGEY